MHNEHWANDLSHEQKGKVASKLDKHIKKESGGKHDLHSTYYKLKEMANQLQEQKAKQRMMPPGNQNPQMMPKGNQ